MPWESIRGHDRVVETIQRSLRGGRLPHAFLFVGPDGIGKQTFALKLAQTLLCERIPPAEMAPCGACPGCAQVVGGTHPDILRVARPEDKHELPIRVIRDLCLDLGLKPARGGRKIAIVDDADDMNDEAANAFLKTLEEPPEGSVLILIGTSSETQLDTIISRCRVVRFAPLSDGELAAVLVEQGVVESRTDADRLAQLGEGSVARARGLADPALADFRRALFQDIADPMGFDAPALARRVEAFVRSAGKESAAHRERARLVIGELVRLFRGSFWESVGLIPPTPDAHDRKTIEILANRVETEAILTLTDRCLEADYHIRRNLSLGLTIDSLTHDIGRLAGPRLRV